MTIALALLATATAIGMTPIPRDQGFCRTDQSHYCYEWKLIANPRQRLVARSDEDGVEYTLRPWTRAAAMAGRCAFIR